MESFGKVLCGEEVDVEVGYWRISSYVNDAPGFEFRYYESPKSWATYLFRLTDIYDSIVFDNHHRKAKKGSRTPTLQQIESAFEELAVAQQTPVILRFNHLNQVSARRWLEKNDYFRMNERTYMKGFR